MALLLGFIIDWVCEMGSQKGKNVSLVKDFCLNNTVRITYNEGCNVIMTVTGSASQLRGSEFL